MNDARSTWSPWRRRVVSVLLLLHLAAIFSAPMAGPPPASDLSRSIESVFDPYLQATFLGHGYRFFAPNPGPSHLLRYTVELPDGTERTHQFPSTADQWPRLFYHRHFMVSEQVAQIAVLPAEEEVRQEHAARREYAASLRTSGHRDLAAQIEQEIRRDQDAYDRQRRTRDLMLDGIAEYLLEYHQARKVTLTSLRHPLPTQMDVLAGARLDDPESYLIRPLGTWPKEAELPEASQ